MKHQTNNNKHPILSAKNEFIRCKEIKSLIVKRIVKSIGSYMCEVVSKNRIMKEMERIKENCPSYIQSLSADEKDLQKWTLCIVPDFTPYKGCQLRVEVEFPDEYPFKPPHIVMRSPIYHPNVSQCGEICLSVVQADNWKPAMTSTTVFDSLLYLLRFPEPELVGAEPIALQYMHDREGYMKAAAEKSKDRQ